MIYKIKPRLKIGDNIHSYCINGASYKTEIASIEINKFGIQYRDEFNQIICREKDLNDVKTTKTAYHFTKKRIRDRGLYKLYEKYEG